MLVNCDNPNANLSVQVICMFSFYYPHPVLVEINFTEINKTKIFNSSNKDF